MGMHKTGNVACQAEVSATFSSPELGAGALISKSPEKKRKMLWN